MNNNQIGKNIMELRKRKKLTQQELGDKLYVTFQAVSKWERGLSLPDITILSKLAEVLDTDIYNILQIDKKDNVDFQKILEEEKNNIKKNLYKKLFLRLLPIIMVILIFIFKLLPIGYNIEHFRYNEEKIIDLGIPKLSFNIKNKENNYSFKNIRSKQNLKNEVKTYLNTLTKLSCNNTNYYYEDNNNITIIDYSVKQNILYNSISYTIRNGNYCNTVERKEYEEKLGRLNYSVSSDIESNLYIYFSAILKIEDQDLKTEKNTWLASLVIGLKDKSEFLEQSSGHFEIIGDELIYYRDKITLKSSKIDIPITSKFIIKNKKLIFEDNYLGEYQKGIILK